MLLSLPGASTLGAGGWEPREQLPEPARARLAKTLGLPEGHDPGAMILLDTNVLIYASTDLSPFLDWARRTIAAGVSEDGAAVNAVSLAEICVGDAEPESVADQLRSWASARSCRNSP